MKRDTFAHGVEPGGLYNTNEIKILICYMLAGAGEPMPRQTVLDIIYGNGWQTCSRRAPRLTSLSGTTI